MKTASELELAKAFLSDGWFPDDLRYVDGRWLTREYGNHFRYVISGREERFSETKLLDAVIRFLDSRGADFTVRTARAVARLAKGLEGMVERF
jgi:hypothetical protein